MYTSNAKIRSRIGQINLRQQHAVDGSKDTFSPSVEKEPHLNKHDQGNYIFKK